MDSLKRQGVGVALRPSMGPWQSPVGVPVALEVEKSLDILIGSLSPSGGHQMHFDAVKRIVEKFQTSLDLEL